MRKNSGRLWRVCCCGACVACVAAAIWGGFEYADRAFDDAVGVEGRVWGFGADGGTGEESNGFGLGTNVAPTEAERILATSIERLEELRSLSAEIDFEGRFFGEVYFGRGKYEEASVAPSAFESAERRGSRANRRFPSGRVRFRLRASLARTEGKDASENDDAENTLEIVCDGERRALWTYSAIEGETSLRRIDLDELAKRFETLDDKERARLAENGVDGPCEANGLPELGGLAGTLKRIRAYYRFESKPEKAEPIGKTEIVKISGALKDERFEAARRSLGGDELEPFLLENLPTRVELFFGKDWPFPYRIRYYSVSEDGEGTRNDFFCVEYSAVARNDATIDPGAFRYSQPSTNFERVDAAYLREMIPDERTY